MAGKRKYERYDISKGGGNAPQIECAVEGVPVSLVDYSLGGIFFHSKKTFTVGAAVDISINMAGGGMITVKGKVVRVTSEGKKWGIAIDFWIY